MPSYYPLTFARNLELQANSLSGRQLRIRVIFERNYVPPFFSREKERVSRLIIVIMMEEREKGT